MSGYLVQIIDGITPGDVAGVDGYVARVDPMRVRDVIDVLQFSAVVHEVAHDLAYLGRIPCRSPIVRIVLHKVPGIVVGDGGEAEERNQQQEGPPAAMPSYLPHPPPDHHEGQSSD